MRWMNRVHWGSLWGILVGGLALTVLPGFAQAPGVTPPQEELTVEVLEPKDRAQVAYGELITGRVPQGYWPFLAVAPLGSAPRIWIQPPISAVKKNGTFNGAVWPGTKEAGIGDKYHVLIFAHKQKEHFHEGQVLMGIPPQCEANSTKECIVSDPITVVRIK